MPIKVVIFEDNKHRREGLELLIEASEGMTCIGAYEDCSFINGNPVLNKAEVVLMDIDMPNVNGIEGVKLIRQFFPSIRIVMQTIFEDNEKIFSSICAGAQGYILKKTPAELLLKAISDVMNGDAPITPSIAKKILEMFQKQSPIPTQQQFNLSIREKEILSFLVKGLSYKMIAAECAISVNTVSTHMHKIYEKLHVHSATEAVIKAVEQRIV